VRAFHRRQGVGGLAVASAEVVSSAGYRAAAACALAAAFLLPAAGHAQRRAGIVFVGSSIFHRWTRFEAQMAPLPVQNLAFDGAQTGDLLQLVEVRVLPLRPKVVVYYGGSNDIDAGEPAGPIVGRIRQFISRVLDAVPDARVVFVSVNRAPEKRDRWDEVDEVNRQMQAYAAKEPRAEFVDVNPALVNADGTPRSELFMNDRLHLRPPAYDAFARILKPVLTKALEFE
jgi:lysophospholipase L1-like esterase